MVHQLIGVETCNGTDLIPLLPELLASLKVVATKAFPMDSIYLLSQCDKEWKSPTVIRVSRKSYNMVIPDENKVYTRTFSVHWDFEQWCRGKDPQQNPRRIFAASKPQPMHYMMG